jgi:hypothetical protein
VPCVSVVDTPAGVRLDNLRGQEPFPAFCSTRVGCVPRIGAMHVRCAPVLPVGRSAGATLLPFRVRALFRSQFLLAKEYIARAGDADGCGNPVTQGLAHAQVP